MLATLSPDLFLKRLCYLSSSSSKRHTSRTYALHPPWERSIPLLVDDARFIDRPAYPPPTLLPPPSLWAPRSRVLRVVMKLSSAISAATLPPPSSASLSLPLRLPSPPALLCARRSTHPLPPPSFPSSVGCCPFRLSMTSDLILNHASVFRLVGYKSTPRRFYAPNGLGVFPDTRELGHFFEGDFSGW